MNTPAWRLIKLARSISKRDPILGYELEQNVRHYVALINPGAESADEKLESTVTVLKSLRQELEDIVAKMDSDADAEEFAKFFDDEAAAEEEELRRLLKEVRSASTKVAGPLDWLKKKFKKSPPKADDSESGPSYEMSDSTMDDFVDGKGDWEDASHYVQEEANEKKQFSDTVQKILSDVDAVRKKPSMPTLEKLIDQISKAVDFGENLMKGAFKHHSGPAESPSKAVEDIENDDGSIDVDTSELDKKNSKITPELEQTIDQYVDALQDAKGDEKKTVQYLQELFDEVKPVLTYDSLFAAAVAASGLRPAQIVRLAHSNPGLRPALLPVLKRIRMASEKVI